MTPTRLARLLTTAAADGRVGRPRLRGLSGLPLAMAGLLILVAVVQGVAMRFHWSDSARAGSALMQALRLEVAVIDDGVGLRLGAGTGHGLSNTRARLASLFGARATLQVDNNADGGVRAVLSLPLQPAGRAA